MLNLQKNKPDGQECSLAIQVGLMSNVILQIKRAQIIYNSVKSIE